MFSLKTTFGRASGTFGPSTFWLLFFAVIILDDEQREEKERRKKRERASQAAPQRQRPSGPRPF